MFEHRSQPLLSRSKFLGRLGIAFLFTLLLVSGSLTAGTIGFHFLAEYKWDDAFHHACLVLGEQNFAQHPDSPAGKIFSGVYVMYARLVFFSAVAIMILPLFHRVLHKLHLALPADEGR